MWGPHTHRHTHTGGAGSHCLIWSKELDTSFICKAPRASSPLVNMSCRSDCRWVTHRRSLPLSFLSDIRRSCRRGQEERPVQEWLSEGRLVHGWQGSRDSSPGSSASEVELNRNYWGGEWHWRLNSWSSGFYIIFPSYPWCPRCGCAAQIKMWFVS